MYLTNSNDHVHNGGTQGSNHMTTTRSGSTRGGDTLHKISSTPSTRYGRTVDGVFYGVETAACNKGYYLHWTFESDEYEGGEDNYWNTITKCPKAKCFGEK